MSLSDAGTVLLVGAGKMGLAMASGWMRAGLAGRHLTLVDPQPHESVKDFARQHGASLRADLPGEVPDAMVIAVKPQVMGAVLPLLRPLAGQALIVSIAAGMPVARIVEGAGTQRVVRAMPNTPAQLGK